MILEELRDAWTAQDDVLGLNSRNLDFIYPLNPRRFFPRADDKLRTKELFAAYGISVPHVLAVFETHRDLAGLEAAVAGVEGFAVKPAQGYGGKGIMILRRDRGRCLVGRGRRGDEHYDLERVRDHIIAILTGVYALERLSDRAFLEELIEPEETLRAIAGTGLPDLRLLVCEGTPAMGMLRVPTRESRGCANLHRGGIGIGIDMVAGRTTHAVLRGRPVELHPDTGVRLRGILIPRWGDVMELAVRASAVTGLGYLGVDMVVDRQRQPLVIEVNARPGLTIQLANRRGLAPALGRRNATPPAVVRTSAGGSGQP